MTLFKRAMSLFVIFVFSFIFLVPSTFSDTHSYRDDSSHIRYKSVIYRLFLHTSSAGILTKMVFHSHGRRGHWRQHHWKRHNRDHYGHHHRRFWRDYGRGWRDYWRGGGWYHRHTEDEQS